MNPSGPDSKPLHCYNYRLISYLANVCPKPKQYDNPNFISWNNTHTSPAKTQEIKILEEQEQDRQYIDWSSKSYQEQEGNYNKLE